MMVIFTSRSEKKAILSTRRILDAFADRIGNDTWKTVITEDGLLTVKTMLKKNATKNTAVACQWIRSRSRSDLLWIVGNRNKFNTEGIVPVNITKKNISHNEWENNWRLLPQIRALTALAALLHDWGKANDFFQKKLKSRKVVGDPFRHEWISCKLIAAIVALSENYLDDEPWLKMIASWELNEEKIIAHLQKDVECQFEQLPPIARLLSWLILSHHRLPLLREAGKNSYVSLEKETIDEMLRSVNSQWGYQNHFDGEEGERQECFQFQSGLLKESIPLSKKIKKWALRLLEQKEEIVHLLSARSLRLVLHYARVSMMLSDHYISSQGEESWSGTDRLFANTHQGKLKQKLDEHLVRVADQALNILQRLPQFADQMESAQDVKRLRQKSRGLFAWQDRAIEKIKIFRKEYEIADRSQSGWFIVNLASTGCGKTIANAKVMQSISADGESLRYILALGLRSLTLQTGDEYRTRIGLSDDELAVLIGSAAIKELHENKKKQAYEDNDEREPEELLDGELEFISTCTDSFLDIFFSGEKNHLAEKNKAFLYKPVLVTTIDHIMGATETVRGGKYILPFLRLMSSDLVLDEIDDFNKTDLTAIARLVHLAGMFGRNVLLSSATIPPDLAEGMFRVYQDGRQCYRDFFQAPAADTGTIACVWCDEFKTRAELIRNTDSQSACAEYKVFHKNFIKKRIEKLQQQIVKRKAYIVLCEDVVGTKEVVAAVKQRESYFEKMKESAEQLHAMHGWTDPLSGKKISFGLIRVANIQPCVAVSQFLLSAVWNNDCLPKIMTYHSRQVLLLRHEQEVYLDCILKRKSGGEAEAISKDPLIRQHIDQSDERSLLFIVVATPVEEVGRDHDFDWAIIEPSSYRSIIQLAGRILRHRTLEKDISAPNIAIMQYNLRGLNKKNELAFLRPGYETGGKYILKSHDMRQLVNEVQLQKRIDAIPRIEKIESADWHNDLLQLEHMAMQDFQDTSAAGPGGLHGWLHEFWWLTGVPQQLNHFRAGPLDMKLYLLWKNGTIDFFEKDSDGHFEKSSNKYGIKFLTIDHEMKQRLWLYRDYEQSLKKMMHLFDNLWDGEEAQLEKAAKRFGELSIPENNAVTEYLYSDQFGLFKKL